MAKSKASAGTAGPSRVAPSSSIDDIFASTSKPKAKAVTVTASSHPAGPSSSTKSKPAPSQPSTSKTAAISKNGGAGSADKPKEKKKKGRSIATFDTAEQKDREDEGQPAKRAVEVVDTTVPPAKSGAAPSAKAKAALPAGKKRERKEDEEDEAFRDSRGTRRKTEEGFLIYKEAELRIDPTSGGTPLCPFDCDCCF